MHCPTSCARWTRSTRIHPVSGSTSSSPGVVARVPAADPVPARRLALGYLEPSVAGHENAGLHPLAGIDHVDLSGTLRAGDSVMATATDLLRNNTSEFSNTVLSNSL